MTRWLLLALLALGAVAGPAAAAQTQVLAERLREDPVLVDPRSGIRIDEQAVLEAVERAPVPTYVLLLPQRDVDSDESGIDGVLLRVVEALDDPRAVVVVVTDAGELQAGDGGSSGVEASALLDRIVQARSDQAFSGVALTDALVDFARGVAGGSEQGAERGITALDRRAIGVAGLVGVVVVTGGLLWARTQRQVRREAPLTDDVISSGW